MPSPQHGAGDPHSPGRANGQRTTLHLGLNWSTDPPDKRRASDRLSARTRQHRGVHRAIWLSALTLECPGLRQLSVGLRGGQRGHPSPPPAWPPGGRGHRAPPQQALETQDPSGAGQLAGSLASGPHRGRGVPKRAGPQVHQTQLPPRLHRCPEGTRAPRAAPYPPIRASSWR